MSETCTGCSTIRGRRAECPIHGYGMYRIKCLGCGTEFSAIATTSQIAPRPGLLILDTIKKCYSCDADRAHMTRLMPALPRDN